MAWKWGTNIASNKQGRGFIKKGNRMKRFINVKELLGAGVIALFITTTANATLELRLGGKAVYDTDRGITWLADPSAASPNAFDNGSSSTDGLVTHSNAVDWLANLDVAGVTGWSATQETERWYNPGLLVTEVDFLIDELLQAPSFVNVFGGFQPYLAVGAGLVCSGFPCPGPFPGTDLAIAFILDSPNGLRTNQLNGYDNALLVPPENELRVLAMHDGDVFAQIPEPAIVSLFGIGLIGLTVTQRRKA